MISSVISWFSDVINDKFIAFKLLILSSSIFLNFNISSMFNEFQFYMVFALNHYFMIHDNDISWISTIHWLLFGWTGRLSRISYKCNRRSSIMPDAWSIIPQFQSYIFSYIFTTANAGRVKCQNTYHKELNIVHDLISNNSMCTRDINRSVSCFNLVYTTLCSVSSLNKRKSQESAISYCLKEELQLSWFHLLSASCYITTKKIIKQTYDIRGNLNILTS